YLDNTHLINRVSDSYILTEKGFEVSHGRELKKQEQEYQKKLQKRQEELEEKITERQNKVNKAIAVLTLGLLGVSTFDLWIKGARIMNLSNSLIWTSMGLGAVITIVIGIVLFKEGLLFPEDV
ncbi:MAG: hypothetical protein SXQ77_05965, partial [Halobacteria archaeon]|nr:hypothetical protein [Halobacteria archaeon]